MMHAQLLNVLLLLLLLLIPNDDEDDSFPGWRRRRRPFPQYVFGGDGLLIGGADV